MTKPATVLATDDARHGRYAGYQAGCRCSSCTKARQVYDAGRWSDVAAGRPRMVPADRARRHIAWLMTWGVHHEVFGTASRTTPKILTGATTRVFRTTEAKILAVTPKPGVNCHPAFSAARRLRSLIALGHPQAYLGELTGLKAPHLSMIITGWRGDQDLALQTWLTIDVTFRKLSMTPGTSNRSLLRAARLGWVPPLAYDNIDDPGEQPTRARVLRPRTTDLDEAVVLRVMAYELVECTKAEKVEITRRWCAAGRSLLELEHLTGWPVGRYGKASELQQAAS